MQGTFHRDRFTWLAYLSLALYGYFLNVLGPITPFLKDELRLTYTVSSFHFTAFAVGILLVGVGGHWVIQRIGQGPSSGSVSSASAWAPCSCWLAEIRSSPSAHPFLWGWSAR
ncbi:MAG: hypothetical protein MZU97_07450 [Bacillus subtilis]|nr:hypothetical protein [Bacillus subtilis]